MRRFKNFLLLSFCLFLSFLNAHATSVLPLSPNELILRAPIVVYGRVVQIQVDSGSGRRTAIFEAQEVAKAPVEFQREQDFYVPLLSRALPREDLIESVSGAPELRVNEELVVFLRPLEPAHEGAWARSDHRRLFALEGFHQGKLRVVRDARGVRRLLEGSDLAEKSLSVAELKKQKTQPRVKQDSAAPLGGSLGLSEDRVSTLRSLDSLLNAARAAAGHP